VPTCGATLDYMLQIFSLAEVIRTVLTASGECGVINWTLLGLSMPWWVAIAVAALAVAGVSANWRLPGAKGEAD
jgi:disulfide bond formation protein DsbB